MYRALLVDRNGQYRCKIKIHIFEKSHVLVDKIIMNHIVIIRYVLVWQQVYRSALAVFCNDSVGSFLLYKVEVVAESGFGEVVAALSK